MAASHIRTLNPATGELLREFPSLSRAEIDRRLDRAVAAATHHARTSFAERAAWMRRTAELLDAEKETFGALMTTEMGKPITAAIAEAQKCAVACRYYAEHAERMLAARSVSVEDGDAWIEFDPLGVVLAVMPWNFPFWQVIRFAAPALMAGNVGVLKHASNVPQCALALEELFTRAGFPANAFQTLLIGSDVVESLIDDPRVAAVTLTGSEGAGRAVAGAAGRNLKKCVVELGGSDPFVVMPSAPLELAVQTAVQARMINNGQSCIAAKRFIVHEQIMNAFSEQFVARVRALRVGDPMDPTTDIGPLATESIARDLDDQVRRTVAAGATVMAGGQRLDRPGSYYAPTVLTHVPLDSAAAREELFGPVAPLLPAHDLDDALRIANDSPFGLGSAAWSSDPDELGRFARELEAGSVALNGMVVSDPRLPFGGVKHSGFGRELSDFGIREFVNVKSVRSTRHGQQVGSVTE